MYTDIDRYTHTYTHTHAHVKMQNMKKICHYCNRVIFDSCTGCTLKDCICPAFAQVSFIPPPHFVPCPSLC